jgi:glycosyltransferase involved in cell wall biosynthesis
MTTSEVEDHTARFSIVSAVYNVGAYLEAFIASIEAQTFPLERLQVIVVDDGSTDDCLAQLEAWQQRRPELVTVVSQKNGGPASARNAGMARARGEWITFTDPDDVLDPGYLAEVDAYLRKRPDVMMVATNRAVFSGTTGSESTHPLRRHFVAGNRLRNLNIDSGHFHGHAASSFFRADEIKRGNLRYDDRLRTTFEDGHFCCLYLLHAPAPTVVYPPNAVYNYRIRGDGTSQLDRSWADPGRFTDVLEHGYLALLREGSERCGRIPSWLQGMVIYELSWYLKMNDRLAAPTAAHGDTLVRFHELMEQICALLDRGGVESYRATFLSVTRREMLLHGYDSEPWHTSYAVVDRLDEDQKLLRVCYRYRGEMPDEKFTVFSRYVQPVHQKIRDVQFFDRTLLHERIVWLPFGTVRVVLDGEELEIRTADPKPPERRLTAGTVNKLLAHEPVAAPKKPEPELTFGDRMVTRLARTRLVRRYFRDAWVLIDRVFNADDSAEHLFRHLSANRPDVNAWFVIESGTPDHKRLRRDGYRRVVAHGSFVWKLLMLNCTELISSHIDDAVVRPAAIRALAEPGWRIVFLQHGVMKDDLSTWLNRKNIDLLVTSTRAEMHSVVDDHTTYRYTTKEVKLTGLPRFDRILEAGQRFPPDQRDLILIAPTWRQWLSSSEPVVTGRHRVTEDFRTSQFATEWTSVINSPQVKELAERTGLQVALLLHPNFQGTARLDTMPHVRTLEFEGQNVQEIFARARVLVTDYSSMFFNAAYIERPIVYFQFDRDRVNAGWHLGRHGYFDYERDGYGPVTFTAGEAVAALTKTVEAGPEPDPVYLQRIQESFPERDGRCCERVVDAILESRHAHTYRRPTLRQVAVGRARGAARRALHAVRRPAPPSRGGPSRTTS